MYAILNFFAPGGGGRGRERDTFKEFPRKNKVQERGQKYKLLLKCYVFIISLGLTVKMQSNVIYFNSKYKLKLALILITQSLGAALFFFKYAFFYKK